MKIFLILPFLIFCSLSEAKKTSKKTSQDTFFRIQFQKGSSTHFYSLKEAGQGKAQLIFKDNQQKEAVKTISLNQALGLSQDFNRIYWQSEYRKPAGVASCTPYAKIQVEGARATEVCQENRHAAAQLSGFLIQLNRAFQKR
jgi:hypothetical protein